MTERDIQALEAIECHFGTTDSGLFIWSPELLTERTMHPTELLDMGMLDLEMVRERATISLDSAIRLLNGMRLYFGTEQDIQDYLLVPFEELGENPGYDGKPHGRALDHGFASAGLLLDDIIPRVEGEDREKLYESRDFKYWKLIHHTVMRNTVYLPIVGSSSTHFAHDGRRTPQHRELRYEYDVRTLSTLRGTAIDGAIRDSGHADEVTTAVDAYFAHLNENNRVDAQRLLGNIMGSIGISVAIAGASKELEPRIEEYVDFVDRMQEQLKDAGVEQAESGVAIVRM